MGVDYKELLLKYIEHVTFYEGINYLSEVFIHGSPSLTDYDLELINELLRNNTNERRQD